MAKKSNKLNKSNKSNKKVGQAGLFNWLNEPVKKPADVYENNAEPVELTGLPAAPSWNTWGTPEFNEQAAGLYQRPKPMTLDEPQYQVTTGTDAAPKSSAPDINQKLKNPFSGLKRNEAITLGLAATDAFLRRNQAIQDNYNYQKRLRNVFTQKPIYDYNYLYGPDASGGTQYQSLIMAKKGANIRRGTSPETTDVEVEGGEFIQLPDMETQHVQGPSHAKGGVHTNLPEGTRVFSDFLKPMGSKKTYAQLAKKYDTDKFKKILDNPYANSVDRNTARRMFDRNESILNELFQDQQIQNGNSDGTDQAAESMGMNPEMVAQMNQEEIMGKFGLDLREGEKLSFTNPFEYGGQYYGGYAEFQDGGQFPMMGDNRSTFYGNVISPNYNNNGFYYVGGDSSFQEGGMYQEDEGMYNPYANTEQELSLANTVYAHNDNTYFQEGGVYVNPATKRKYKVPKDATVKKEGDKSIKAGDYVVFEDGTVKKVSKVEAKIVANTTKSSSAADSKEGIAYVNAWAQQSPENNVLLQLAEGAIEKGIKDGTVTKNKDGSINILGGFKPNFRERLAISQVLNVSGKHFGTPKYKINSQAGTSDFSRKVKTKDKSGKESEGLSAGSFVGGFTPMDYEQRATYSRAIAEGMSQDEAIALAESTDSKQKAENRKKFLTEIGLSGLAANTPDSYLITDDFYKNNNRYEEITKSMEKTFPSGTFRPSMGDDALGGFEHYDAAAYVGNPRYLAVEEEEGTSPEGTPPGNKYNPMPPYDQVPSTPGKFPLYQGAPEVLGFLAGMTPYTYYTPDYTHTEIVPPTLNIDDELQSINSTLQSAVRQTTGNPSLDNSRNSALFNTALQAKQQAFAKKQNYDANARFQADQYNAQARDLENFRDVSSAAQVYNEYRAAAMDAAETERLNAVFNLVDKNAKFNRDEALKMMYFTTMFPNYYYEGTDLRNPIKVNPNARNYWNSQWANQANQANQKTSTTESTSVPSMSLPQEIANMQPQGIDQMINTSNFVPLPEITIPLRKRREKNEGSVR